MIFSKLKIGILIFSVAIFVLSFAPGCQPAPTEETVEATEAETTAETKAPETEAAKPFDGITLSVFVETGPHGTAVKTMAVPWEELTGAKVVFTTLPGWPELYSAEKMQMSTKSPEIDVYQVHSTWLPEIYTWLAPLDDLINDPKYKDVIDVSDFFPAVAEANTFDGKLYGLPLCVETLPFVYRTDMLSENGYTKPPETLDEMLEIAKKCTNPAEETYGFAGMAKRGIFPYWHYVWILNAMGGQVVDENGNPALDSTVALDALNYMVELYKCSPPASADWSHFEAITGFVEGNIAMITMWDGGVEWWMADPAQSKVADKIDIAVPPGVKTDGTIRYGHEAHIWNLAINPNGKNVDAAFDLISYVIGKPTEVEYLNASHYIMRKSIMENTEALKVVRINTQTMAKALETTVKTPQLGAAYISGTDFIGTELSACLTGMKTPEQALKDANAKLKELLGQ